MDGAAFATEFGDFAGATNYLAQAMQLVFSQLNGAEIKFLTFDQFWDSTNNYLIAYSSLRFINH
jgi:hypothetical protein